MKYIEFRQQIKLPIFTPHDLALLGITYTPSQLTTWQQKGYLTKLRGGLYTFTDILPSLTPAMIAPYLVAPSYISLATALSHYEVIPEAVYTTTCITSKGTRTYHLPSSDFSYRHLPPRLFFGYLSITTDLVPYNMAETEKALLDYLYLTPAIKSATDLSELRLNLDSLDWTKLKTYTRIFKHKRLSHLIKLMEEIYAHA